MTICCADIGSVKAGNFGWARLAVESDQEARSGSDIRELSGFVGRTLAAGGKVALGFECPLWVPVADDPRELTTAREGEGKHPWAAGAGAVSLATGLTEVVWVLDRIRRESGNVRAFLDWESFQQAEYGVFLWEAIVTGKGKTNSHEGDARVAVEAFKDALPDPTTKDALRCRRRTRSLIGAALLWAGWSEDIGLLSKRCLVIRNEPV